MLKHLLTASMEAPMELLRIDELHVGRSGGEAVFYFPTCFLLRPHSMAYGGHILHFYHISIPSFYGV
jgi:hypothetical protein